MNYLKNKAWAVMMLVLSVGCTDEGDTVDPATDDSLTLRKIVGRYYGNLDFLVGMSESYANLVATDSVARARQGIYYAEFAQGVSDEKFRQDVTAPTGDDRIWNSSEYTFLIEESRNQVQTMLPEAPLGPDCSEWVAEEERTTEELEALLVHYVSTIGTDVQLNNDVVHRVIVAEDLLAGETGNPWLQLGVETGMAEGAEVAYPRYLALVLGQIAESAPSIAYLFSQRTERLDDSVWGPIKRTILALKSNGLRIDGICWDARIPMGWEQDPDHVKDLLRLIDWCYLNDVEFHVTHLMVAVSGNSAVEDVDTVVNTRTEQAATYAAVVEAVAGRAGRGAGSVSFGTLDGCFVDGITYAGLYDKELNPVPAYEAVKNTLIRMAKN